ncbi:hypothetical protein [Halomonas sp. S2151]|uniref:hypothetical protein n=1 Tax=Halomonas sp. S2151 TaxID=579478 RepID=UPI0012EDDB78|nr:hypothetical protein [Halomonas sp. S2151]
MSEKEVHAEYVRVMAARKAREEERENQRQAELVDAVAAKVESSLPKQLSEEEIEEREKHRQAALVDLIAEEVESRLPKQLSEEEIEERETRSKTELVASILSTLRDQRPSIMSRMQRTAMTKGMAHGVVTASPGPTQRTQAVGQQNPDYANLVANTTMEPTQYGMVSADGSTMVEDEHQMLGEAEMKPKIKIKVKPKPYN